MKKHIKIIRTDRLMLLWLLVFIAGSFLAACVSEKYHDTYNRNKDEALVFIAIDTPRPSLLSLKTRAQTDSETEISSVKVLVLEFTGDRYEFRYQVSGTNITSTGDQKTRFETYVKTTDKPQKLIILPNAEGAFASYTPSYGTTEAELKKQIKLPFTSTPLTGNLPMYGELLLPDGITAGDHSYSLTVLRAIARVDVVKDLEPESDEFVMEGVYVFRGNNKIQMIPDELNPSSTTPKVDAPSIPDDSSFLGDPVSKEAAGGAESITQLYIPESAAAATVNDKLTGTTVLVVGGRFGGSGNPVTYYRADFDPGLPEHPFGQVLRNHRYVFNIKKVTAKGWDTAEEAANNLASSLVVDVQTWEDFSSDLYFGNDRLAVSSRSISLRFVKNREKRLDVESTLTYQIQWLDENGNPVGSATSEQDITISNNNFDVTIVKDSGDPEYVTHLLFRTRNNNHNGNVIANKLRITVDNWNVEITVKQDNTAMYSKRHFSVLSGQDYFFPTGSLGTTTNQAGASGLAMRRIIDRQFAPGALIGIGGFAFDQANDSNGFFGATSAANLDIMRRIIRIQNVIYLSYETFVSNEVADILLTWLDENPDRVLIVGTDTGGTNSNLLSRLTGDAAWLYDITSIGNGYLRAGASEKTDDFFSGPFGEVAIDAPFNRADNYAGYSINFSNDVTPLIIGNNNRNAMVFGINKNRRIIYHGDANLFQNGRLSNDDGNVNSDLDRLMANLWAWITEQLIYGND